MNARASKSFVLDATQEFRLFRTIVSVFLHKRMRSSQMARGVNFFLTFGFKIRKDEKSSRMANRTAPHTGAVFTGDMQTLRQNNRVFTNCILVNCEHLKYARTKTIIFTSKNSNNAFYTGGPEKKIPKSRKWRSVGPGRKTRNGGFFPG